MVLTSLFSIVCWLIISSSADDICLSFSGGGIRAAMGAYYAMRGIEEFGVLSEIKSVSLISGGSWGFIMWLFEDDASRASMNILKSLYERNIWGPHGPIEQRPGKSSFGHEWFDIWSSQIRRNIFDFTSLKMKPPPSFDDFRQRLSLKGLQKVKVYFVVESVAHKPEKATFKDYCWFSSSHTHDLFECTQDPLGWVYPIQGAEVKVDKKRYRQVHLQDVLNYCSSAWATIKGKTRLHKQTTREFRVHIKPTVSLSAETISWNLIDAGGTFNDPLLPYMVNDEFISHSAAPIKILNFDFSEIELGKPLGNLKSISVLNEAMTRIRKGIPRLECDTKSKEYHKVDDIVDNTRQSYICKSMGRIIHHYPLYGMYSKEKIISFFPTMRPGPKIKNSWRVKRWNIMEFMFFAKDWHMNVKHIIQNQHADRRLLEASTKPIEQEPLQFNDNSNEYDDYTDVNDSQYDKQYNNNYPGTTNVQYIVIIMFSLLLFGCCYGLYHYFYANSHQKKRNEYTSNML